MIRGGDLLIRNVEVEGRRGLDVRLAAGVVAEIGQGLRASGPDLDGRGGALIPGLIDHHIHLFALAAAASSVSLPADLTGRPEAFRRLIQSRAAALPPGEGLRVLDYDEGMAGELDRWTLDAVLVDRPLRVQHRTGALWVLNSAAVERALGGEPAPACVERHADGDPTGRIWRGDGWLRARPGEPPSLAAVGAELARLGVTGVTDASVTNDAAQSALFSKAVERGELPQRLMLMGGGPLEASPRGRYRVGPVKLLLDDARLPDFETAAGVVRRARAWGRPVAVHCVTAGELAFTLALLAETGAAPGDRIEHGGVIHPEAAGEIARLSLTVVTQPGFPAERGDRYLAEVDPADVPFLYPCAGLLARGIRVGGSSDAPYTRPDPWAAMAAAVARRTPSGRPIGLGERIDRRRALGLFLGDFDDPGGVERRVVVGAPADLCLLKSPLDQALAMLSADLVAVTVIAGRVVAADRWGETGTPQD